MFGVYIESEPTPEDHDAHHELEGYVTPLGGKAWGLHRREDRPRIPIVASQITTAITHPCVIKLAVGEEQSGKLEVKYRGVKYPGAVVFAPKQLYPIAEMARK